MDTERAEHCLPTTAEEHRSQRDRRFFGGAAALLRRPCRGELLAEWLPALDGVTARLEGGARVADIRCGHGYTTACMAGAFPHSTLWGFDPRAHAIGQARENAALTGYEERLHYAVADETHYPCAGFHLICFLGGLLESGDPPGAARHAARALAPGGMVVLVERSAQGNDDRHTDAVLDRLAEVFGTAGFSLSRRVTRTPFNLVLEARLLAPQPSCRDAAGADARE